MASSTSSSFPYSSCKQLSHLISSSSGILTSEQILRSELTHDKVRIQQLERMLLTFKTDDKNKDKRTTGAPTGKLSQFLSLLSDAIGIDVTMARPILAAYLAGDFRGTKSSLRRLIDDPRFQLPLIRDVWQFYRAERLYLLQAVKEILVRAEDHNHPHTEIFAEQCKKWRQGGKFIENLMEQLEDVVSAPLPPSDSNYFSVKSWIHFTLREQTELLQIILLFLQSENEETEKNRWKKGVFSRLLAVFQGHGFGHRQKWAHLAGDAYGQEISESVGHLEAIILMSIVDLPALAEGAEVFGGEKEVDKLVAALGSHSDHGPVMMTWMLAQYITKGEDSLAEYHGLGERAVQLRAVSHLARAVDNEVIVSNARISGIAKGICYSVLSVLVSAFEPERTGLSKDVHELSRLLLRHENIAADFWKQGYEAGLGIHFGTVLSGFPHTLKSLTELCTDLASAGSVISTNYVLACLENVSVFAEPMETVPATHVEMLMKGSSDRWRLLVNRLSHSREIIIPAGSAGISDGRLFRWSVGGGYNGWKYLLGQLELLDKQLSSGLSNVCDDTLVNGVLITELLDAVLKNSTAAMQILGLAVSKVLFSLLEKLVHLATPPLTLLANSLRCLSVMASQKPRLVWEKLSDMGLFPFVTRSPLGVIGGNGDVNSGVVGAMLARQECVNGEYPLTVAFLDLLLACLQQEREGPSSYPSEHHPTATSVLYVIQDILPVFQQWRFSKAAGKEKFGQKVLKLCHTILASPQISAIKQLICEKLLNPAPCRTLISLVGTGDRAIQTAIEAQSNWENGPGVELAAMVDLAMTVFEMLLVRTEDKDALADLNNHLCSPATGGRQHFLLVVSHYIYHLQSLGIPISAMRLLSTVARIFPMSLLACLGNDAEAVRDILLFRLESQTEDVKLKVAMLGFFSACVETQPGFIQLLIGAKNVDVVNVNTNTTNDKKRELTKEEAEKNERVGLVSESGCLAPVIQLLKDSKRFQSEGKNGKDFDDLHLATTNFFLSLWVHGRIVAISYLKGQNLFWTDLTWSLMDKSAAKSKKKINTAVFRIVSSEIYICGGKVDPGLLSILEKLTSEKNGHFEMWCRTVLDQVGSDSMVSFNTTAFSLDSSNDHIALLSAWKCFLVVLSKDQPVSLSPVQCHVVASKLISTIRRLISSEGPDNTRVLTSLSEVCLVLMQRWQTKCADSMEAWCMDQAGLLEEAATGFDELHPRSRAAILAITNTALKTSSFKLDDEESVLASWLEPTATIVRKSLYHFENNLDKDSSSSPKTQVPILSVSLLRNLIQRLSCGVWYSVVHHHVLVQSLLSRLHHSLRRQADSDLVQTVLGLLISVGKSEPGCGALLSSDLAQMLWLPLSDVKQATKEWIPVFQLCVQLATTLLSVGKQQAVENCINVVALLQEQLTTFLHAPKVSLEESHVDIMVSSASFIGLFMSYHKQWQLHHPATLVHFYRAMCSLIHVSICLLVRPSLLGLLVSRTRQQQNQQHDHQHQQQGALAELARQRRISTTSSAACDAEVESSSPEVASVQNGLLDGICAGLSMLRRLSPDLAALVSGDVHDHGQYEQLLGIGFSSPTFEQDDGLTYGTLISIANLSIRAITRGDRSPSPAARAPSSPSGGGEGSNSFMGSTASMDRRRLMLVLEQSLTVILSQALLCLSDPRYSARDKQLLRRELGSEMGSFTESLRRHAHRGSRSPLQAALDGGSGGGGRGDGGAARSDEHFMKFISSVVHNVFK